MSVSACLFARTSLNEGTLALALGEGKFEKVECQHTHSQRVDVARHAPSTRYTRSKGQGGLAGMKGTESRLGGKQHMLVLRCAGVEDAHAAARASTAHI